MTNITAPSPLLRLDPDVGHAQRTYLVQAPGRALQLHRGALASGPESLPALDLWVAAGMLHAEADRMDALDGHAQHIYLTEQFGRALQLNRADVALAPDHEAVTASDLRGVAAMLRAEATRLDKITGAPSSDLAMSD